MRETIGGMMVRKMIEAAAMNAGITREEKTEMKEYKCKVELSKEYTITAANPTEAREHAAALFMMEATDENPHVLTPLIQIAEVGTEEDDLDWDYEEDEEDDITLFYEDSLGYSSDYAYGTVAGIVEDIAERYRLTDEEAEELEEEIENHIRLGGEFNITYELPYIEISVYRYID